MCVLIYTCVGLCLRVRVLEGNKHNKNQCTQGDNRNLTFTYTWWVLRKGNGIWVGLLRYGTFQSFFSFSAFMNKWIINATHTVCLFVPGPAEHCWPASCPWSREEGGGREVPQFRVHSCCRHCSFFSNHIYIYFFFFEGINIISVTLIIFFCIYHVNHTGLYHNYVHTLVSSLASVKEAADRQANHVLTLLHAHMGRTHAQPLPHSTATLARRHDSSWTTFVDQLN